MNGDELLRERVSELRSDMGEMKKWRRFVDKDRTEFAIEIKGLRDDVREVERAVAGLRRMLIMFALTIAGSALVFGFSVLTATGRI